MLIILVFIEKFKKADGFESRDEIYDKVSLGNIIISTCLWYRYYYYYSIIVIKSVFVLSVKKKLILLWFWGYLYVMTFLYH